MRCVAGLRCIGEGNAVRCRYGIFHHQSVTCNTIWPITCPAWPLFAEREIFMYQDVGFDKWIKTTTKFPTQNCKRRHFRWDLIFSPSCLFFLHSTVCSLTIVIKTLAETWRTCKLFFWLLENIMMLLAWFGQKEASPPKKEAPQRGMRVQCDKGEYLVEYVGRGE